MIQRQTGREVAAGQRAHHEWFVEFVLLDELDNGLLRVIPPGSRQWRIRLRSRWRGSSAETRQRHRIHRVAARVTLHETFVNSPIRAGVRDQDHRNWAASHFFDVTELARWRGRVSYRFVRAAGQ